MVANGLEFLTFLENELKRNPNNSDVRFALAEIYLVTGHTLFDQCWDADNLADITHPIAWYEKSLALNVNELGPDYLEALHRIALCLHLQARQEESMQYVKRALALQEKLVSEHPLGKTTIRFLQHRSGTITNIGHLVNEPEFFTKMGMLGMRAPYRGVFLAPLNKVVNPCALSYWRKYICVITDERLTKRIRPISRRLEYNTFWITLPNNQILYFWSGLNAVQQKWEAAGRGPLLKLRNEHAQRGRTTLKQLGVPEGAWFVTLHVRDQSQGKMGKAVKGRTTTHRDAKIETYHPAIKYITDRGGWVIRMGDISMPALSKMDRVIDYAHSDLKSDWMDIFLVAASKFYLGTASGLNGVPVNFGVPSLLTNVSPMDIYGLCSGDIYLPKLMRHNATGRYLSVRECLSPPFNHCFNTAAYAAAGVTLIDNTSDEIVAAVAEMLDRLDNRWVASAEEESQQKRFRDIVAEFEPYGIGCRVGARFIQSHSELLN